MRTIKIVPGAVLFLLGITIYSGCKKTDYHAAQVFKTPQERFFALPSPVNPIVMAIARKMQQEECQKPYVADFVHWAGYPVWSKAKVLPANPAARLAGGSGIVMIPCAKDSESKTSAIVFAKINGTDTVLSTAYYYQYKSLPYKTVSSTGLKADNVALIFMAFDMDVYGDSTFYMKDNLLFRYALSPRSSRYVNIKSFAEGRSSLEICFDVYDNDDNNCPQPMPPSPTSNPSCGLYARLLETDCFVIDFSGGGDTGNGFPDVGGSPGSGTAGGGWSDNPCRNTPAAGVNPCTGGSAGPGWVPYTTPPSTDPCSGQDRIAGATATLQYSQFSPNVGSFSPFTSGTQPEEYFLVNDVNGAFTPTAIASVSTTGGALAGAGDNTVLLFHTHPDGGYPSPSPADFFALANYTTKMMASYVIAYTGAKYAIVVRNYSQFQAFVSANSDAISSTNGFNTSTGIGLDWEQIRQDLLYGGYSADDAYERALAKIMEGAGVTLVKAEYGSDIFKKIGIQQRVVSGVPQDVNGHKVYDNTDCP